MAMHRASSRMGGRTREDFPLLSRLLPGLPPPVRCLRPRPLMEPFILQCVPQIRCGSACARQPSEPKPPRRISVQPRCALSAGLARIKELLCCRIDGLSLDKHKVGPWLYVTEWGGWRTHNPLEMHTLKTLQFNRSL
uniref:Uncharacterized protein n=1 Tax=Knipowitschia caucasica TaxID=637954 RepID=A0AAV2JF99_KNICA